MSPGEAPVDASSHHMSDRSCQSTGQRDPGEADTGGAGGGGGDGGRGGGGEIKQWTSGMTDADEKRQ